MSLGIGNPLAGGNVVANKMYRYTPDIKQMMFVFGEVKDPDDDTIHYIEDIVRGQIAEVIIQARILALRRGSRSLSTEDLIFLIRHDRAKVTRLKTYLGWKDVRKKAKDTEGGGNDPVEIEEIGGAAAADEVTAVTSGPNGTGNSLKAGGGSAGNNSSTAIPIPVDGSGMSAPAGSSGGQRMRVKIPWDLITMYSEYIPENSDDEDEDEKQAYEDSKRRLRDADNLTKSMTREEYTQYSEARQASFTWRKGKRFRDFINYSSYIEGNPNDEVMDALGFMAYEMVRALCEKGLKIQSSEIQREMQAREQSAREKKMRLENKKKLRERRRKKLERSKARLAAKHSSGGVASSEGNHESEARRSSKRKGNESRDDRADSAKATARPAEEKLKESAGEKSAVSSERIRIDDDAMDYKSGGETTEDGGLGDIDDDENDEEEIIPSGPFSAPIVPTSELLPLSSPVRSRTKTANGEGGGAEEDGREGGVVEGSENPEGKGIRISRQPLLVRHIDQAFEEAQRSSSNRMRAMRCFTSGPGRPKVGPL